MAGGKRAQGGASYSKKWRCHFFDFPQVGQWPTCGFSMPRRQETWIADGIAREIVDKIALKS